MKLLYFFVFLSVVFTAYAAKDPVCSLPLETGPCRGSINKYAFNANTQKCESIVYGGCEGNANNFGTLEKCKAACES